MENSLVFQILKEDVGFQGCRHDQSILTNLAVRDGLSVIGQEIRSLIECNADYWYERYFKGQAQLYRPIDTFYGSRSKIMLTI